MWYSDQEECFEISDDLDIHERMWSAVQECGSIPGAGRVSTPKLRLLFKDTPVIQASRHGLRRK